MANVQFLRWMKQSTWNTEILYYDRSLKDEQLLTKPFLWKTKNTNVEGGWNLKFIFCFMETTHEHTSFIWIIIFFYEAFKYSNGVKFWDYIAINAEPLCRILQCHVLVKYISFCLSVSLSLPFTFFVIYPFSVLCASKKFQYTHWYYRVFL
jgi:hypothetical protein